MKDFKTLFSQYNCKLADDTVATKTSKIIADNFQDHPSSLLTDFAVDLEFQNNSYCKPS